jgi:hypothetical protein
LIEEHKKRVAKEPFQSGADDINYDELDRLLQDAVDLQGGLGKERTAMKAHGLVEEQHAAHDDAVIQEAAHSGRATPSLDADIEDGSGEPEKGGKKRRAKSRAKSRVQIPKICLAHSFIRNCL